MPQTKRELVEGWFLEEWDIEPLSHPSWQIKATHRQNKRIIIVSESIDQPETVLISAVVEIRSSERQKLDKVAPAIRAAFLQQLRTPFSQQGVFVDGLPLGPDQVLHQLVVTRLCRGQLNKPEFLQSVGLISDCIKILELIEFQQPRPARDTAH